MLTTTNCYSPKEDEIHTFQDYLSNLKSTNVDTSKAISYDIFESEFDTIPIEFGYFIFDSIIHPISFDTSLFIMIWGAPIKKINKVMVCRKNLRLDPNNEFSNETFYFLISYVSFNGQPTMATVYVDLKYEYMGTFIIENHDSIKTVAYADDKVQIRGLRQKLIKHRP